MHALSIRSIPASACTQLRQIRQGLLLFQGLENSRNLLVRPASCNPPPLPAAHRTQGGVAHLSPKRPTWVCGRRVEGREKRQRRGGRQTREPGRNRGEAEISEQQDNLETPPPPHLVRKGPVKKRRPKRVSRKRRKRWERGRGCVYATR